MNAPNRHTKSIEVEIEPTLSDDALEEIIKIARKQAALLGELKQALLKDDVESIKRLAARLCGVADAEM